MRTQPKDMKFTFPDLFPNKADEKKKGDRELELTKERYKVFLNRNKHRPGLPGWFSI